MTMSEKYRVCKNCKGAWCWERGLWKHTRCYVCGSQFPKPKLSWAKGAGKAQQAESDWPVLSTAGQQRNWVSQSAKPARKVFGALNQVWNFIPEEAQKAITGAGFKVQTDPSATGPGNGKEKDVLKLMGVEQPTQPTPDLTELCRQRIDALPESIKMLLEKQTEPEKAPTVTETSRKFKVATADLRELILKKSTLQLKINKTKTAYTDLLTEMQQLQETLAKQQQEVTSLQQELQDRVQAEQPPPGPSLLQTLQDIGIQITEEQATKLAGLRFQLAGGEDTALPSTSENDPPPPGNSQTDMDVETPPGLQQVTHHKERNGRSRSR